jgi:hypothetical protein
MIGADGDAEWGLAHNAEMWRIQRREAGDGNRKFGESFTP